MHILITFECPLYPYSFLLSQSTTLELHGTVDKHPSCLLLYNPTTKQLQIEVVESSIQGIKEVGSSGNRKRAANQKVQAEYDAFKPREMAPTLPIEAATSSVPESSTSSPPSVPAPIPLLPAPFLDMRPTAHITSSTASSSMPAPASRLSHASSPHPLALTPSGFSKPLIDSRCKGCNELYSLTSSDNYECVGCFGIYHARCVDGEAGKEVEGWYCAVCRSP